ncbi:putative HET domain-containing protein [Rosellinia necatrix]|uniref:Putative HET domain-containing protein n=1 Tax=Rosellinia necatrix TaxID=77044 RepID=A0A1S7UNS2_ROSNE|nr:putative HET domain-containing protein [Rosellinia necatrix]
MLSTRVLHFGRYEVFFESAVIWTKASAYTPHLLSKSTDRLPAVGGLAKQIAMRRKSRYLAGLWEYTLNDDLLWRVHMTSRRKRPRLYPLYAPTWSWASVQTWVGYWDEILVADEDHATEREERPDYEHYGKIERCEVDRQSSTAVDEFSLITRGSIIICGLVAEGVLEREVQQDGDGEDIIHHYVAFPGVRLPIKTDYLLDHDNAGQTSAGANVFCLRMSRIQEGSTDHLISLVLRKSPSCHFSFERIGMLIVAAKPPPVNAVGEVSKGADLRTVSIV